jgi:hypothetical protein
MSRKRNGAYLEPPNAKKSRNGTFLIPGKVYNAHPRYRQHPDSGVGDNFHSLPYPLTLLPYKSWCFFHRRREGTPDHQFLCPECGKCRGTPTPHQRKLFLVAERLSWQEGLVPTKERLRNEEALWEVNFELGILDPSIEDSEQQPGGKNSRANMFYPYDTEQEAETAFGLIQQADRISESSFNLWVDTLDGFSTIAATQVSEDRARFPLNDMSSSRVNARAPLSTPPSSNPVDQKDLIEDMSFARFPEAILQKYCNFLQNVPFPLCFRLAECAGNNSACRTLLESVARRSASQSEHELFKKILDECYTDYVSSRPQNNEPLPSWGFDAVASTNGTLKYMSSPGVHQPQPFQNGCFMIYPGGYPAVAPSQAETRAIPFNQPLVLHQNTGVSGPKDKAVLALLSQKALEHLDLARLLGRMMDNKACALQIELFDWLYEAGTAIIHRPENAMKALDILVQSINAPLAHRLSKNLPCVPDSFDNLELTSDEDERVVELREGMALSWPDVAHGLMKPGCTAGSLLIYYCRKLRPESRHESRQVELQTDLQRARTIESVPFVIQWLINGSQCRPQEDAPISGPRWNVKRAIEHHARSDILLRRLFLRVSSRKSSEEQVALFLEVVQEFESFDQCINTDYKNRSRHERYFLQRLKNLDLRIEHCLLADNTYFAHQRLSIALWTPVVSETLSVYTSSKSGVSISLGGCNGSLAPAPIAHPVQLVTTKSRCLADFYRLLDKIERTSYMGMRFLETYAEYLKKDACTDCWFRSSLMDDDEFEALEGQIKRELDTIDDLD